MPTESIARETSPPPARRPQGARLTTTCWSAKVRHGQSVRSERMIAGEGGCCPPWSYSTIVTKAGAHVELHVVAGMWHAFFYSVEMSESRDGYGVIAGSSETEGYLGVPS